MWSILPSTTSATMVRCTVRLMWIRATRSSRRRRARRSAAVYVPRGLTPLRGARGDGAPRVAGWWVNSALADPPRDVKATVDLAAGLVASALGAV